MRYKNPYLQEMCDEYHRRHMNDVISHQQLMNELNWYMASKLTDLLYEVGYISCNEYERLTALNCEVFSPMFAELMPKASKKIRK